MMQFFGPNWLFFFNALVYAILIAVILYRMQVRGPRRGTQPIHRAAENLAAVCPPARRNGGDKR